MEKNRIEDFAAGEKFLADLGGDQRIAYVYETLSAKFQIAQYELGYSSESAALEVLLDVDPSAKTEDGDSLRQILENIVYSNFPDLKVPTSKIVNVEGAIGQSAPPSPLYKSASAIIEVKPGSSGGRPTPSSGLEAQKVIIAGGVAGVLSGPASPKKEAAPDSPRGRMRAMTGETDPAFEHEARFMMHALAEKGDAPMAPKTPKVEEGKNAPAAVGKPAAVGFTLPVAPVAPKPAPVLPLASAPTVVAPVSPLNSAPTVVAAVSAAVARAALPTQPEEEMPLPAVLGVLTPARRVPLAAQTVDVTGDVAARAALPTLELATAPTGPRLASQSYTDGHSTTFIPGELSAMGKGISAPVVVVNPADEEDPNDPHSRRTFVDLQTTLSLVDALKDGVSDEDLAQPDALQPTVPPGPLVKTGLAGILINQGVGLMQPETGSKLNRDTDPAVTQRSPDIKK